MTFSKANKVRDLDPNVWRAFAGCSVQIPRVDSRVYYFPQGHAEQAISSPDLSSVVCSKPCFLCRVVSVRFLANPETDEVFTKIRLHPIDSLPKEILGRPLDQVGLEGEDNEEKIVSFSKILTSSDANNGGGFSVPRFCADSIFPPLDYKAEPPMQTISVRDVHGEVWEFRHIYRGTPRRHLLTTGWSKFVNQKKLISGDSVVFIKNQNGEISVGVRRTSKSSASDCGKWNCQTEELRIGEGFSRSSRGRISAESVLEAVELAVADKPFDIVCYPRSGSSDFVVKGDKVEESMSRGWTAGMRVKIAVEAEDSSRLTWFQGTVSATAVPDHEPWCHSPWRVLQVNWDEPEVLQNLKRVSPWQVELVATIPSLQGLFPCTKKLKGLENSGFLTDVHEPLLFPMIGHTNSMMGHFNPSLCSYNTFSDGIQGARHDSISVSNLSKSVSNNTHHVFSENPNGNNTTLKCSPVSTELNIGGASQTDNSSPYSQGSMPSFGTELLGDPNSVTKIGGGSFQLFGKVIHVGQPVETEVENGGCTKDDGHNSYKNSEGITNPLDTSLPEGVTNPLDTSLPEGVTNTRDMSLSYPYKKLYKSRVVQCKRVSALEACSL